MFDPKVEKALQNIGHNMILQRLHGKKRRDYERAIIEAVYRSEPYTKVETIRNDNQWRLEGEVTESDIANEVLKARR